jgi:hypothetical protein
VGSGLVSICPNNLGVHATDDRATMGHAFPSK